MNTVLKVLCAAAALSLASFATAAPGQGPRYEGMPKGDVSKADFLKHMEERFNLMDANKDGVLSEAERKTAHEHMRAKRDEYRKGRMASKASAAK